VKALSLLTFLIAVISVSAMLDQDSGLSIWLELRGDLETENVRVEQLIRENDALRAEITLLEEEPAALDRAIREELDLVLPGEFVVRFEPRSPAQAVQREPANALGSSPDRDGNADWFEPVDAEESR
jgi:cell division protein FtsB